MSNPQSLVPLDAQLITEAEEIERRLGVTRLPALLRAAAKAIAGHKAPPVVDPVVADNAKAADAAALAMIGMGYAWSGMNWWLARRPTEEMPHAELEYAAGPLDTTAPKRIWLQIDTAGDNDDRGEEWPGADGVTWQDESIGGLEIQYVRADLVQPAPTPKDTSEPDLEDAA